MESQESDQHLPITGATLSGKYADLIQSYPQTSASIAWQTGKDPTVKRSGKRVQLPVRIARPEKLTTTTRHSYHPRGTGRHLTYRRLIGAADRLSTPLVQTHGKDDIEDNHTCSADPATLILPHIIKRDNEPRRTTPNQRKSLPIMNNDSSNCSVLNSRTGWRRAYLSSKEKEEHHSLDSDGIQFEKSNIQDMNICGQTLKFVYNTPTNNSHFQRIPKSKFDKFNQEVPCDTLNLRQQEDIQTNLISHKPPAKPRIIFQNPKIRVTPDIKPTYFVDRNVQSERGDTNVGLKSKGGNSYRRSVLKTTQNSKPKTGRRVVFKDPSTSSIFVFNKNDIIS